MSQLPPELPPEFLQGPPTPADPDAGLTDLEKLQKRIERMDALLAQGREAMLKVDQFYREHNLVPGEGEKFLTGDAVSPRDREIFRRLIAEYEMMEERLLQFEQTKKQPTSVSASVKAVGSRYRI